MLKLICSFRSRMEKVSLNLLDVGGKARSKSELYKLLTVEGHLYLPPYKFCSVDFMADIIEGKRKVMAFSITFLYAQYRLWNQRRLSLGIFLMWKGCDVPSLTPPPRRGAGFKKLTQKIPPPLLYFSTHKKQ